MLSNETVAALRKRWPIEAPPAVGDIESAEELDRIMREPPQGRLARLLSGEGE